jgi:hypothetical protein
MRDTFQAAAAIGIFALIIAGAFYMIFWAIVGIICVGYLIYKLLTV